MHRLYTYVLATASSSTFDATTPIAPLRYDVLAKAARPHYKCAISMHLHMADCKSRSKYNPSSAHCHFPPAPCLLPPMMRCTHRIFHYPSKHPESEPRALLFTSPETSPRFPNTIFHSPPQPPIYSPPPVGDHQYNSSDARILNIILSPAFITEQRSSQGI